MQIPLKISTHSIALAPAMEDFIRERAERLERFYPRLTRCNVMVNGYSAHHRSGGPVSVRIHLGVPGDELTVDRQEAESVEVALREAFDAARRQLQDHWRLQRGKVKTHEPQPQGQVIRLFPAEGYGFLLAPDGREVYFHAHSVLDPGFDVLQIGSEVRYTEEQGDEGPQASSLTPVGTRTESPAGAGAA
jgi:cold shock CspA family protein